ncbi:hypothetical protein DFH09DRAFT_1413394 [Mycena vulgaris]|nr:hypothetical protein DFH09DRAFT_1413394 [Mycena vulgaris]
MDDTVINNDDMDQSYETDWIPTEWIGCGKKYRDIPPIVDTARHTTILKIPSSFTNNLPRKTMSIAQLLLFELPPLGDSTLNPMDDDTEGFTDEQVSPNLEELLPVPHCSKITSEETWSTMMDLLSIRLAESAGPISNSALVINTTFAQFLQLLLPDHDGLQPIAAHPGAQKYLKKFAIKLAKRDGLKVIASAGFDEKVKFMLGIGADVAFNYKTSDTREVLAREGPIDVYWENVDGEVLDAALEQAALYARFIECGMISGLSPVLGCEGAVYTQQSHLMALGPAEFKPDIRQVAHDQRLAVFRLTVPQAFANGEIKYSEDVSYELDKVGDVLQAKAVVVVTEE